MKKGRGKIWGIVVAMVLLLCACSNKNLDNPDIKITEKLETSEKLETVHKWLVLKNANLIDGTGEQARSNIFILIKDGRFHAIGTQDEIEIPAEATVVDVQGATVLPGFINAHVHQAYDEENLRNWLKAGVTTVRSESPGVEDNFIEKRDERNADLNHAFIVSATPILKVEGGYGYGDAVVSSPEDAEDKVLEYIESGVDIIKISVEDNLPIGQMRVLLPEEYIKRIVDVAHSKNIRVSVHVSQAKNLKVAIDAGVDDFAHMVVDKIDAATMNEIIKKNIYFVPTLELWSGVGMGDMAISNLSEFYKAGGKIALGTDFAGYTITFDKGFPITEVLLMQDAGMSNMDIIIAATKNASVVCGMDKEIGTVEVGKKADLLIVEGNPLKDITVLGKAKMVIHNGSIMNINE